MGKNREKELDSFLTKTLKVMPLDEAPVDFTANVLKKIALEKGKENVLVYKPLISRKIWFIIIFGILGLSAYLNLGADKVSVAWLDALRINTIGNLGLAQLFNFQLSNSLLYSFLGLGFFIVVQVLYLRQFFSKRRVII